MNTVNWICECNSWDCPLRIDLPLDVAMDLGGRDDIVAIVDGCQHGPDPTDELIEKREGYSLYRKSQ